MRYIFLDTETTGLNPNINIANSDRIVEIGCVEMIERNLTGKTFHTYLNPQRNMPIEAFNVHGLSQEFLQDKPLFKDIANDLLKFIEGSTLIIHNASFDLGFLDAELSRLNIAKTSSYVYEVIDSLKEARKKYPNKKNSLDALCDRLEINRQNRDYHGALLDSQLLANVWLAMGRGQDELLNNDISLNYDSNTKNKNQNKSKDQDANEHKNIKNIVDSSIVLFANAKESSAHADILKAIKANLF
jgi:DNA polymerase III subunit epsilon